MQRSIILLFMFLVLTACGLGKKADLQPLTDPEESARLMMQVGNYTGAAIEYLSLAEQYKKDETVYRLKSAAAYVEAGRYLEAEKIVSETSVAEKDSLQNMRRNILSARLELEFGQPGKALERLKQMVETEIPSNLQARYYDILAKVYLAHGDYLYAASARLKLANLVSTPTEKNQNYQSLWQIFEVIPESDLDELRLVAPEALGSWFEFAAYYQSYRFQPDKFKNAVEGWIQRYPGHPAYTLIFPSLIDTSVQFVERPNTVGLLLPFSERYEKASTAIRDGFLAAWYMDNTEKSEVLVYNTDALNIVESYQQAVGDGVDYVIGPLEKEAINRLLDAGKLSVPVLALNRQDPPLVAREQSNLIQFALAPEDEVRQIAEMAMSDGHALALSITPNTAWGQRIADIFEQRWVELGGAMLERVSFEQGMNDYSAPVMELLNIDSSEQRGRDLRSKLNRKIDTVERRRQDADFIFAVAVPGDARQLFPQFRFYRAGDIPVYSTSHIYSGVTDVAKDSDMDGVLFIDIPWLLDSTRQLSIIQTELNQVWGQDKSSYRRLYALGIDTYHLIPEINRLKAEQNSYFSGETGDLRINRNNVVERKLRRAQFVKGKPVLLN